MKNLSLSILLFFVGILNFTAQETNFEYISSSESQFETSIRSEVLRNTSETYVRLSWLPELCAQGCTVEFKDNETNEIQKLSTNGTSFDVRGLETPHQYSWRVLNIEGENTLASQWETFTTEYMSPVQTRQELSGVLKKWKDNTSKYENLEAFLRDQKDVDSEILETFIMNFYKGLPPSLDPSSSRSDCNCEFVVTDNVYFSAPETYYHNDDGDKYCGYWERYDSRNIRHGAAKDMELHLKGRIKDNAKEFYFEDEFMSYSALTVQYMCDQDDCCDADYKVAGRIDQKLYGHGDYDKKGGYRVDVADLSFIVESRNGDAELIMTPSAKALTVYENTTVNPQFWSGIFDLVVAGLANYEGILELDPDSAEALFDAIEALIGVQPVIQEIGDDNGNSINAINTTPTLDKTISANETVTYGVFSNSLMSFDDAWGKKFWCNKGYINVDAHIKTGYSIAISSKSTDDGECCRNDYAKWVTGSYLGAANAQTMLAEAGLVVGCNGGEWLDNNGNTIACPNSDPFLTTAIGIATKDNDCCVGSDLNTNLDIDWTCLEGSGNDGNWGCKSCTKARFNIAVEACNDGNQHAITILEVGGGITNVLYQNNNFTGCNLQIDLPLKWCRTYRVLHSVIGECTNETATFTVFKTCCKAKEEKYPIFDGYEFKGSDDGASTRNTVIDSDIELNIFPNPSLDHVTFSSNADAASSLQIVGMDGKVILTKNLERGADLKLLSSDFGKGIFVARLITGSEITAVKKFTILD